MQSAHDLVNTLFKQATDSKLKSRYSSCLENYNDGIDDLRGLSALLKSRDYSGLNIHASAALDDPSTCDDNFSDPPAEAPQLKVASDKVQGLIEFVVVRHGVRFRDVQDDGHGDRFPLTYIRFEDEEEACIYGTTNFRVFQVDLPDGKVTETRELGDRAFFIGHSASLSIQASQFPGIKSNHIYFTDDFWETYLYYEEGGGFDMGVFSLADGSIQPHYEGLSLSRVGPPTWVTPTLY